MMTAANENAMVLRTKSKVNVVCSMNRNRGGVASRLLGETSRQIHRKRR
jgi:hypothetical protein